MNPPFNEKAELNKHLTWNANPPRVVATANKLGINCVPGHPLVSVDNREATLDLLRRDLLHDRLNKLFPLFWLLATPRSSHISALHHQLVRGREIVITEDPGLHLLWYGDKVYIKPLPPYLTNYAFWKLFLSGENPTSSHLRKAALGYVRSYFYLIRHQSDFNIALDKRLVTTADFGDFLYFVQFFQDVGDDDVTPRYQYGELRLSRLNLYSKFYRLELFYHKAHWQYGPYFTEIIAPVLFVFAAVSVALGAMQVVLAVEQAGGGTTVHWARFNSTSQWFSITCLLFTLACAVFLFVALCFFVLRELAYALRHSRWWKAK